ncbi:MAG: heparinase II/III family protein [Planctomycetota bacterium]|nr:heparinase II/III family protein [Planctomycetota bacterium]
MLFSRDEIAAIKARAQHPKLRPVVERLMERAEALQKAPPLLVSLTKRGEKDAPGEMKGLSAARNLQGRTLTYCMAFTLTGDKKYRDAAVKELDHALTNWKVWVDTAHAPPYDLMTGEVCMTFGLVYDWLYSDLTPDERQRLREGAERRGLKPYLEGLAKKMFWTNCHHNWNAVCNGGAAVLALALEAECDMSAKTIQSAVAGMKEYWDSLPDDGGWNEGTGYWTYGHRYGILAAEALRRCGNPGGAEVFQREGVKKTCYFPIVFNPGTKLSASFGDASGRAGDPFFYLLGREYKNADFIWFGDRAGLRAVKSEGWPGEPLILLWRPVDEPWLPEARQGFIPVFDPVYTFPAIGWGLMAPSQPDPPYFLGFKNGSLAANHTHLDLNHVSVACGDTMLLVELGARSYPADYFGAKRYTYYELGTPGHNTVLIGGKGQTPRKAGKLLGPFPPNPQSSAPRPPLQEFVGVADGAYEVPATRARRHAVFVRGRYWVLLDDIATPRPETVELRFHTYGKISGDAKSGWTFEQDNAALDIVPGTEGLEAEEQSPDGWIKPVKVLSLKSKDAADKHVLATVLYPRASKEPHAPPVQCQRQPEKLTVKAGADEVQFELSADGWKLSGVK